MNYLETIYKIFTNHQISKVSNLIVTKCQIDKERSYKSEGIKFESELYSGEIFHYFNTPYCEIEFVNLEKFDFQNTSGFYSLVCEYSTNDELTNFIERFLDLRLKELK